MYLEQSNWKFHSADDGDIVILYTQDQKDVYMYLRIISSTLKIISLTIRYFGKDGISICNLFINGWGTKLSSSFWYMSISQLLRQPQSLLFFGRLWSSLNFWRVSSEADRVRISFLYFTTQLSSPKLHILSSSANVYFFLLIIMYRVLQERVDVNRNGNYIYCSTITPRILILGVIETGIKKSRENNWKSTPWNVQSK